MIEEEWVYIPAGGGLADIDGKECEVGPGDFIGFPAPGIAHMLRNSFEDDLAYLMGGEAVPLDVLDCPTLGKRFLLHYAGGPLDFYEGASPLNLLASSICQRRAEFPQSPLDPAFAAN
jgi:uncharacterized cupin superfamily protein